MKYKRYKIYGIFLYGNINSYCMDGVPVDACSVEQVRFFIAQKIMKAVFDKDVYGVGEVPKSVFVQVKKFKIVAMKGGL